MARAVLGTVILACIGLGCAQPLDAAPGAAVEEVVAAERAFAAETVAHGFKRGFLAYAAADAVILQPGPVAARPALERLPDKAPPGSPLDWWPQFAGISVSGDLGFTTGAASVPVRYFTVWRRQADGGWKWIFDGGPPLAEPLPGTREAPVSILPGAGAAAGSAEAALGEIAPLEADLAAIAAGDAPAAHLKYLTADALVAGSGAATLPGAEQSRAELARRPQRAALRGLGGTASAAGDLAFTYGAARWEEEGGDRNGHYVRIWQNRREGWRLVVDMLIPTPRAPGA